MIVTTDNKHYGDIANAIRAKLGVEDTYKPDEIAGAIINISGGGGDTSVEDGLVEGSLTGAYSNDRVTKIKDYTFYGCSSLTTASLPVATSVGTNAFGGCSSLITVSLPAATDVGSAFNGCSSLTIANLPVATSIGNYTFQNCSSLTTPNLPAATDVGRNAFSGCSSLTTVSLPAATRIEVYTFQNCSSLTIVDLPLATSVSGNVFRDCYSLTTLILRNTTTVCKLLNVSAFTNCYHYHGTMDSTYNPNGSKDGYIYVPASLIEDYKVATNWSTLATQFRALEDFTVDGTTTGELDESKI